MKNRNMKVQFPLPNPDWARKSDPNEPGSMA